MWNKRTVWMGSAVLGFALVAAISSAAVRPQLTNDVMGPEPEIATDESLLVMTPACPHSAKGGGMGGNKVSCEVECRSTDLLKIAVWSADGDAEVSGNGECGAAKASCSGNSKCTSTSTKMAGTNTRGTCQGASSEAWTSALTLDCQAVPSDLCSGPVCAPAGKEQAAE